METNTQRVATVKATGEQFVVINLDLVKKQVVCQPDVYAYSASRSTKLARVSHVLGSAQRFSLDDVVIRNVTMTLSLAKTLLAQSQAKVKPHVPSEVELELAKKVAVILADVCNVRNALNLK